MKRGRSKGASSNMSANIDVPDNNLLMIENKALKKKNLEMARKMSELKSSFREIEKERNMLHSENVNMLMEHRKVKRVAKTVCNNVTECLRMACLEITKLFSALEEDHNKSVGNLSKEPPSLINLPEIESQLLKSASCTLEASVNEKENVEPNPNSYRLRNDRLDTVNESVANSTALQNANASNKENTESLLQINLTLSPRDSKYKISKRRNMCSFEKGAHNSIESEYEESNYEDPNSMLTNVEDELKDISSDTENSNIELNFDSTLGSTSTPYKNINSKIQKIRPLPESSSSSSSSSKTTFSDCHVQMIRLSSNQLKVLSPNLATSPVPSVSPRPTRSSTKRKSSLKSRMHDETLKPELQKFDPRSSMESTTSTATTKSESPDTNPRQRKKRKKSIETSPSISLSARPKRITAPVCLKEKSSKVKLRRN